MSNRQIKRAIEKKAKASQSPSGIPELFGRIDEFVKSAEKLEKLANGMGDIGQVQKALDLASASVKESQDRLTKLEEENKILKDTLLEVILVLEGEYSPTTNAGITLGNLYDTLIRS